MNYSHRMKAANLRNMLLALVLMAPALVLFSLFVVVPVVQAGYYSFYNWNGMGPPVRFIGFDNFLTIFQDRIFQTALLNNIKVVFVSLCIQLPLAFVLALLIGRKHFRGEAIFRSIFFFPYILAEIVTGIIWRFIYHPEFGLPTIIAGTEVGLLGDPSRAFGAVLVVIVWKFIGFHMILYIAGLQGVPRELEDAATVDGANRFQVIWSVIIPCMRNTFIISVFLSVIGSLNVFDIVWALGQGGPVNSTETLVTYLYNFGFRRFAFGYGSAVAVIIFVICFFFNILYQRYIVGDKKNEG